MARETWVYRNGEMVLKGSPDDPGRPRGPRSDLPAPMLIRDTLPDLKGMHDGKIYDSRSNLQRAYKEAGVRVVESGEAAPSYDDARIKTAEVAAAYRKVSEGYRPTPLPTSILPTESE